ncbi:MULTISPECIES: ATP-binding protein [Ramlibacter]|uniref:histidine kinase n=1 Tax=Ramlibacter aquaticus TaxID=2780094 RepID=A0ABR9SEL2_9BURK|nr:MULTISPECIES: ATP-binding protein [Ramlibacter]MBE7940324.1 PAS domain S-box protein [Ramlibacter aquaticus]
MSSRPAGLDLARPVPTIRQRLNALVLSAALPAAIFAAVALGTGYWMAWRAVESSLTAAAASLSSAMDNRLLRLQTGLQAFALAEAVDPATLPRLRSHAMEFQRTMDAVNMVLVREDGAQVLNTLVPEGRLLPHEPPSAFREEVLRTQQPVIRNMFRGPVLGDWLSAIGVPARSTDGQRYVLGASLTPHQLQAVLAEQELPEGWVATVLDRQDVIAARMPDQRFVGLPAEPALREALRLRPGGVAMMTNLAGAQALTAYHRSPATGWTVSIGIPRDALWQPLLRTLGWLAAAALLTLLGSLALARKLGGRIADAMAGLARTATHPGSAGQTPPRLVFREAVEVAGVLAATDRQLRAALSASDSSRARLRAIIDTAVDAVIVLGPDHRIEVFNPAAAAMFGRPPDVVMGQPLQVLVPDWVAVQDELDWQTTSLRGLRSDGESFPVQASVSRGLAEGQGFLTVILRDVTQEERTRDELLRSNEDLQRFASVASHDMRSPLRTLQGFLGVMAEQPALPAERRQDLVHRCLRAVRQLDHLTGSLLAFARLNAQAARLQPVALDDVAQEALALVQASIDEAGATVQLGPLPRVWGVHGELVQLLQNLIANAVHYRREGIPPRVEVQAVAVAAGWRLSVRDNGIGIAPEYHRKVFGIFERLHAQREYTGSGIGLATCARIAERHGGRIWVESRLGEGATFHVELPAVDAALPA